MATLNDVATRIADQIARSDLTTQIKAEIGYAIEQLNREVSHVTELRALELTTAANTLWYSTVDASGASGYGGAQGATMSVRRIVEIVYMRQSPGASGVDEPMTFLPYRRFEVYQEGSVSSGDPEYYTLYAGQIGVWPRPSGVSTLEISAHVKPTVPSADADQSVWIDEYRELVEAMTTARVALKYLQDTELAGVHASIADPVRKALALESAHKSGTGRITPRD